MSTIKLKPHNVLKWFRGSNKPSPKRRFKKSKWQFLSFGKSNQFWPSTEWCSEAFYTQPVGWFAAKNLATRFLESEFKSHGTIAFLFVRCLSRKRLASSGSSSSRLSASACPSWWGAWASLTSPSSARARPKKSRASPSRNRCRLTLTWLWTGTKIDFFFWYV